MPPGVQGTHRRMSDRTHLPIQQGGVERAGKKVINYYSLKKVQERWKLQRSRLGSSAGQRDVWKNCCCLLGLSKVVTAVPELLKTMVFHVLICTTTSFKKLKHAINISHMNLIPYSSSPGISWHALEQQALLIHLYSNISLLEIVCLLISTTNDPQYV